MITQQKNSVKRAHFVDTQHLHAVIREYKQTRWVQNSERLGKPDSLSAWFSVEAIEEFLEAAKTYGGDGVKLYFSVYPENFAPYPEYIGRQTVTMVATKSKETKMGGVANKDLYITRNGKTTILGTNLAIICPPNCNPSTEGGMGELGIAIIDKGEKGMEIV
jgi:hypothetical protein